jgi:hypothetical protein
MFRYTPLKNRFALSLLTLCVMLFSLPKANASDIQLSESAKFSILTCTPGPDLYSLFGHSAIRLQDNINGQMIDWVYNYGTFEFDDSFYWKFAMGKLDYLLSKEHFGYFQQGYILEGRGIFEQELRLSSSERQRLFTLLETNYLPENRTYRYDFFYDNCSSRVRDIINQALDNKVDYTYPYKREHTFRQAIQSYLDYQPWSDLGIDIALGIPCDKIVGPQEMMFLPDSLMNEYQHAQYHGQPLAPRNEELLPLEYELSHTTVLTPMLAFFLFMVLHLAFGFLRLKKGINFQITDRVLLFITGTVGVVVMFLWFFTDHTATVWNLNILWANPINLVIAFSTAKSITGWKKKYLTVYCVILILTLLFWFLLPQRLHLSLIALIIASIFTCMKLIRPQFFSKTIKLQTA